MSRTETVLSSGARRRRIALLLALSGITGAGPLPALAGDPPRPLWKAEHPDGVTAVAFSPDGQILASAGAGVKLWNATNGAPLRTIVTDGNGVQAIVFSPDGKLLAGSTLGAGVGLWRVAEGQFVRGLSCEAGHQALSVAFFPDGQTLAVGNQRLYEDDNRAVTQWNVADGKRLRTLVTASALGENRTEIGATVAVSPDGKTLALSAYNGITLWRVADGTVPHKLPEEASGPMAFSSDGLLLATGSADGTLRLWRATDGMRVRSIKGKDDNGCTVALAFSPDGKLLASATTEERAVDAVTVWSVAHGGLVRAFDQQQTACVAFSPDGKLLAWGRLDGIVVVARVP